MKHKVFLPVLCPDNWHSGNIGHRNCIINDNLVLIVILSVVFFALLYTFDHDQLNMGLDNRVPKGTINQHIGALKIRRPDLRSLLQFDIDLEETQGPRDSTKPISLRLRTTTDRFVGYAYALVITLLCLMVVLILMELEVDSSATRLWIFHVVIGLLIVMLSVVIPLFAINLLIFKGLLPDHSKRHQVLAGAIFFLWLVILHFFGDLSQSFTPELVLSARSLIERKINEISIAGITFMAFLSGLGSASTLYDESQRIRKRLAEKLVGINTLNALIQSFNNTTLLLRRRSQQLEEAISRSSGKVYLSSKKGGIGGIMHKVQSFASLALQSTEEQELADEIDALKKLQNHVYDDFIRAFEKYNFQHSYLTEKDAVTILTTWSRAGFAVYCVYRIISVLLIKFPLQYLAKKETNANDSDALAITIAKILINVFGITSYSESQLVHQICFLLSGGLFVCSISSLLTTLNSVRHFLFPHISASIYTWLKYLSIAELFGIYVMATALLIRTNLPENLSNQVSKVLSLTGSLQKHTALQEVEFIDNWFDKVFAFACILTFIQLFLRETSRKFTDDLEFGEEFDEELMIETTKFA